MRTKLLKIITLFIIFVCFLACSKTEQTQDISKLSNEEKIQLLDIKIRQNPKDAELYYQRAEVFYELGNTKEAIYNTQKAIELNKKEVKYYILQADIFFSRGETTMAFSALQDALKINKKSLEANLKIAELSLYLKDYKRCLQSINDALTIDKVNAKAFFLKGWIMKETGDTNLAVQYYKKAIELKSDYEEPFEELGILYAIKGDALAVDYLKSTIKINPKNINAMYALAMFYQQHNAEQQALDLYQQILNIKPDYIDAINNVGWINYKYKQDYDIALECFNKVIELDSTFYLAYYNRSDTYKALDKNDLAQKDLIKAQALEIEQQ